MKKDLTELVFVIDMSGSMSGLTDDTIGGFNSVLSQHQKGEGDVLVTTFLFNNDSKMIHDRTPIKEIKPMTEDDYRACGCTALLDTLGSAIKHIANIHRYAREEDVPEHTIFIITTDGMENASHKFSADEVKGMVKHEQEKYGWEFIYLASNIDAVENAARIGIDRSRAVDYCPDKLGTQAAYESISNVVETVRCSLNPSSAEWRRNTDRDFKERKKK